MLINTCIYDTWSIKSSCHVIGEFYHMLIYNNTFTNFLKRCVKESSLIHCLENVVHLNIWRKYSCCLIVQNLACTCVVCLGLFVSVYRLLAVVAYALIFLLGEWWSVWLFCVGLGLFLSCSTTGVFIWEKWNRFTFKTSQAGSVCRYWNNTRLIIF